jgi:hypothetical protein
MALAVAMQEGRRGAVERKKKSHDPLPLLATMRGRSNKTKTKNRTQQHENEHENEHETTSAGERAHENYPTNAHRYTGTQVHRYTGKSVHRYTGKQIHRYALRPKAARES